jgi:hypothetical protein
VQKTGMFENTGTLLANASIIILLLVLLVLFAMSIYAMARKM